MSSGPDSGPGWGLTELYEALARFAATDLDGREVVSSEIWHALGTEGAAMVLDMSGFSRLVQQQGIVHYLSMVGRMQRHTRPLVEAHGGIVVKYEADNLYALFPDVAEALAAGQAMIEVFGREQLTRSDDRIAVSIGVDFGPLLHVQGADFFGECVNTASKLGEDLAAASEMLISRRAASRLPSTARMALSEARYEVGGLDYDAFSWAPDPMPARSADDR